MKEITTYFFITLTVVAFSALLFNCKSTKATGAEQHTLMITLQDDLTGKYISDHYQSYSPSEIKRSNKTLNQYLTMFNCDEDNYQSLIEKLSSDDSIIAYKDTDGNNSENKIQSGKNDKRSKTKPIRNKK